MSGDWARYMQPQGNAGQAFADAFKQGQKDNEVKAAKNAMSMLARNPSDPTALAFLAKHDPERFMEFRKQSIEMLKAHLGEHADNILKGAQIFRAVKEQNPGMPDDQVYARALPALHQMGITDAPPAYDPTYVQNALAIADALKPQNENDVQNIPYQAGGGVLQYNKRSGETRQLIVPNDDPSRTGQHVGASAPVTATGPGGHKIQYNPQKGAWEPVGGQAASPPATFP